MLGLGSCPGEAMAALVSGSTLLRDVQRLGSELPCVDEMSLDVPRLSKHSVMALGAT